jgi:GNAT superfamily N-acetyltransferase
VVIPPPAVEITVLDASDPRLPDWVHGHFAGEAWVVLEDGEVLSTAVLKRYDERLREISVGTAAAARGRGLARSVVAAAARAVLAEGRAVLYNHAVDNDASARVAESVGLHELGRYHAVVPDRQAGVEYGEDDTAPSGPATARRPDAPAEAGSETLAPPGGVARRRLSRPGCPRAPGCGWRQRRRRGR